MPARLTLPTLQLHNTDCLTVMRSLPDESVKLIVTDPPYFKVKGEAWDRQWKDADKFLAWLGTIADEWRRILAPNGSLYCFAGAKLYARTELLIAARFNVINAIVWDKTAGAGRHRGADKNALRGFFPATERIVFAEQSGADSMAMGEAGYASQCEKLRSDVFAPLRAYIVGEFERAGMNTTAGKIAANVACGFTATSGGMAARHYFSASQWWLPTAPHYAKLRTLLGPGYLTREYEALRVERDALQAEYEALRVEYEALRRPFNVSAEVPYTDVWTFPTVGRYKGKHPCEKPRAMADHIIAASSRPGDVVLDSFMGTGVFGEAALAAGRDFIGIDSSTKYFPLAQARLADQLGRITRSATL